MKSLLKSKLVLLTSAAFSGSALAEASPIETAISNAVAAGQSNFTTVVVGVIALAAIGFGLSAITGAMRR